MVGKDILLIAGGIGFPPIRALLAHIVENRKRYGEVDLFYGARSPKDIVYKKELREWGVRKDIGVHLTVDVGDKRWKGRVGVITTLLTDIRPGPNSVAAICGPPIMIKFVVKSLLERGAEERQMYASMERLMQCGFGVCGHCNIGKVYVCKDGPVFRVDGLKKLTEGVW
jgi:NAD(P)H-flavin reductase